MFDGGLSPPNRSPDEYAGPPLLSVLPGFPSRNGSPLPRPGGGPAPNGSGNGQDLLEEVRQAKREIELLKSMDPFRAAEMAIELQVEKMRAADATSARDSAVQRLASAYDSIKEKALIIGRLQNEKSELEDRLAGFEGRVKEAAEQARVEERRVLEDEMCRLRDVIRQLKENAEEQKHEPLESTPPLSTEGARAFFSNADSSSSFLAANEENGNIEKAVRSISNDIDHLVIGPRPHSVSAFRGTNSSVAAPTFLKLSDNYDSQESCAKSSDPADMVRARNSVLAFLPTPSGIPEEALKPIMIPAPFTIHEFLGNTTGTTRWSPDHDEHGYFLTPLYKCTTKARVPTAHSWSEVDPRGRMTKPTECFYSKEGKWYYAGQYIAIRLDDLSTREWVALDPEASSMLIKDTLAGRKNTSPNVHYEVSQLYTAGALKVACVGLQCVGFNSGLYHTIMEQAAKCQQSGRWKVGWGHADFSATDGSDSINGNGNVYPPTLFNFM
ncbi:hypothetical protein M0805_007742 [Coniferiporia weirii]|nr:hypothetical protein M0805_007742 [Coniferiporia weirii]